MFRLAAAAGLAAMLLGAPAAQANLANFSFQGTFSQDDNVQLFNFTADGASAVTLVTYSYAGGTNAAGTVIPRGGFDPILALFDSTGALVGQNDDGGSSVPADSVTGAHFDTFLQSVLAAGSYTVAVMEYDNFAVGPNLSDGFGQSGGGDFTGAGRGFTNCPDNQPSFQDVTGVAGCGRTNAWAFDVLNVEQAVQVNDTPEPISLALLGTGLLGLAGLRRRR